MTAHNNREIRKTNYRRDGMFPKPKFNRNKAKFETRKTNKKFDIGNNKNLSSPRPKSFQNNNKWNNNRFQRRGQGRPMNRNRNNWKPARFFKFNRARGNKKFRKIKSRSDDFLWGAINFKRYIHLLFSHISEKRLGAGYKKFKGSLLDYWKVYCKFIGKKFSWSFTQITHQFYFSLLRSFIKVLHSWSENSVFSRFKKYDGLKAFYAYYKLYSQILILDKLWQSRLSYWPRYYFRGFKKALKRRFYNFIIFFCFKIFITQEIFKVRRSPRAAREEFFFSNWRLMYKKWLNTYFKKRDKKKNFIRFTVSPKNLLEAHSNIKRWLRPAGRFVLKRAREARADRRVFSVALKRYFVQYHWDENKIPNAFRFRKNFKKYRITVRGRRIYNQKKRKFMRKSRKYVYWFKRLVTQAYYYKTRHMERTLRKKGLGRKAWMGRRKAKSVFKMKFVFMRYFCKKFGLKNSIYFLRKAQIIARAGGNKWLRYYKFLESRLIRVLILFNFCENNIRAKNYILNEWVMVNRKLPSSLDPETKVSVGDFLTITREGYKLLLKRRIKFFFKRYRYRYNSRAELAGVYKFYKALLLKLFYPENYHIVNNIVRYGRTAILSAAPKTSSSYFSVNKAIPFYNRKLFKIFVQKFSKKLN